MADIPHYCTGCGELHGGHTGESEALKIAKVEADRDIRIAELARTEAKIEAEAAVEQTETVAEAAVDQAVVEAEAIIEAGAPPEDEPEVPVVEAPVVVEAPPEEEPGPAAPPEHEPPKTEKSGSGGWWAGYSG